MQPWLSMKLKLSNPGCEVKMSVGVAGAAPQDIPIKVFLQELGLPEKPLRTKEIICK